MNKHQGPPTCCLVHCENPAGVGTHLSIEVPQIGTSAMTITMPVCEEHWVGNWAHERRRLVAKIDVLRSTLKAIDRLAGGEAPS